MRVLPCILVCLFCISLSSASCGSIGTWFEHIIIFMFENHSYDEVEADPNFGYYSKLGKTMTNYFAIVHPSQPNYWCQISGDYFGITSDSNYNLPYTNIVDLFEANNITWKAYEEDFPGNCNPSQSVGYYYRKHNPFISFDNVRNNATRCAKIVNSNQLDTDLAANNLPQYMYFTPNINNDAHDTNIAYAGKWLRSFLTPRISKFPKGTLFVLTWDEDDKTEGNQIYTVLFGSMIAANSKDNTMYTHYSLLRTVEDNWNLGNLGRNDATANHFFN